MAERRRERSASSGCSSSALLDVLHRAGDPIEADAGQPDPRLGAAPAVGDDHDRLVGTDHVTGVLREAALQADVDGAPEVSGGELARRPGIQQDSPTFHDRQGLLDGDDLGRLAVVEELMVVAVGVRRECEVEGRHRLTLGDRGHELLLGHRP